MSDKYAVITAHRPEFPVGLMCVCRTLTVSPSGFYGASCAPVHNPLRRSKLLQTKDGDVLSSTLTSRGG